MEILQTLWNALTSENEFVLMLVSIPMTILEISLAFLIFTKLLNIRYTRTQASAYILLFALVAILTIYFIPAPYNTYINIIAQPVLVYLILKTNALKSILSEIIVYVSLFIIVTPLIAFYTNVFNVSSMEVSVIPIHKLIYSCILYFVMFLVYKLFDKLNIHVTFLDKFDTYSYNVLITNFIVGIIAVALQAYIEFIYIDYLPHFLVFASLFILIIYFSISLYSLYRTSKLEETRQLLAEQKLYNHNLNSMHDRLRIFRHDFNNIVQTIGGYLSTDNIDKLKIYYNDLLEDCQISNNLSALDPELINNPVIYSLVSDKYHKAAELDIKLNLEVTTDLSNLNVKMYELSKILGILLDNAIDAASHCEKKVVNITFRKDKIRNKDLVIVQNTYTNKDVDIEKIFEKGYTSKQDNEKDKEHGLGLWEVRKYLKKNAHLDLYTSKTDELFIQQFEIYN